ncbi:hypothetical protein QN372_00020 [Undibacterium sp. RTI2.1]|uniref:hypothetical protein n=1 Tax=unclassified Undibacterium TaxID=2630295 RepID=UPI002AB4A5D9|nr:MULTISPECIES: hypothetical protein [unclassified Undibacterium]MDY7537525.1 hypothetical protein [Undibacterium sp. 5I1]MEB0029123.1 hypothetical protein [Undibacterium sp. RTI2.1]MEB0115431.1 hypothetical protein [Undibacterium sp. RTI2.2]MEB0232894.1 hypothetical protein [Undibacterium sp. 10I3]MEB0256260.1 hypothetical protein [Undibacterium sp. 5I1]
MHPTIEFKDHVGLVHLQAKKGFKWADGAKSGLTYDDMFQEASVAFVMAKEGFNPDLGIKFSAYFSQVAFSHFRRAIGQMTGVKNLNPEQKQEIEALKEENQRRAAAALPPLMGCNYGIKSTNFSEIGAEDESFEGFESTIDSGMDTPEQILEFHQIVEQSIERLSPIAQLIVEWLRDPPAQLIAELDCQIAHADQMEETGSSQAAWRFREGLSISKVGNFLQMLGDIPRGKLVLAENELLNVVTDIEKAYRYGS